MSHFPVLVVGDDLDEQLAPYDEHLDTAPRREHLDATSITSMAAHYGLDPANLPALQAKMEDWKGCEGGIDENGLFARVTYNQHAQWDWYEVGGRWNGFLKLKPGTTGIIGRTEFPSDEEPLDGFASGALKADIDVDGMRDAAEATARTTWRAYSAAIDGTPSHQPWSSFLERVQGEELSLDAARLAYGAQPRVRAFDGSRELQERLGWLATPDGFPATEDAYAACARALAVTTFAYVIDGAWHDRGDMGWWGITVNEKTPEAWAAEFAAMLDRVPDDTRLTVVDCHI